MNWKHFVNSLTLVMFSKSCRNEIHCLSNGGNRTTTSRVQVVLEYERTHTADSMVDFANVRPIVNNELPPSAHVEREEIEDLETNTICLTELRDAWETGSTASSSLYDQTSDEATVGQYQPVGTAAVSDNGPEGVPGTASAVPGLSGRPENQAVDRDSERAFAEHDNDLVAANPTELQRQASALDPLAMPTFSSGLYPDDDDLRGDEADERTPESALQNIEPSSYSPTDTASILAKFGASFRFSADDEDEEAEEQGPGPDVLDDRPQRIR